MGMILKQFDGCSLTSILVDLGNYHEFIIYNLELVRLRVLFVSFHAVLLVFLML